MKLYDVIYENNDIKGTALISAEKAGDIQSILRCYGKLNASVYKVVSIREVGCSNYTQGIISEYIDNSVPPPSPSKKDFDINHLSLEDVSKLKSKINQANKVLFVDKIVSLTKKPGELSFHPNADVGYSFMNIGNDDRIYKKYHVYVKTKDGYKDLGIPSSYFYIQSGQYRIKINNNPNNRSHIKEDIRSLRLGLFQIFKKTRNHKKVRRVKFIDFLPNNDSTFDEYTIHDLYSTLSRHNELVGLKPINVSEYFDKMNLYGLRGLFVIGKVKRVRIKNNCEGGYIPRKYKMIGKPLRYIKGVYYFSIGERKKVKRLLVKLL